MPRYSHLQIGNNNSNCLTGWLGGLKVPNVVPNTLEGLINVKYHYFLKNIYLLRTLVRARGQKNFSDFLASIRIS